MYDKMLSVKIQEQTIKMMRFADDTTMLGESQEKLEETSNVLVRNLTSKLETRMNKKKTRVMVVSRSERNSTDIKIRREKIEEVNEFKYLK